MDEQRFPADMLLAWSSAMLRACGVPEADALLTASVLLRTSLRGIDTHGVARVPLYAERLRRGEVKAAPRMTMQWQGGALQVDGDGALGQVVAHAALAELLARGKAPDAPAVLACSMRHCGHLGALGVLALPAAEQGRIALLCQRTPPLIGAADAAGAAVGNNPLAFVAPLAAGEPPLVFDIACSVAARGHLLQAQREGKPIPDHWAVGPDGEATTDAVTALRGHLLPMGGHKGLGLAMMVEVLAAGLAGWGIDDTATSASGASAGGTSAFLLVIDPARFGAGFDMGLQRWLQGYLQRAGAGARYPGQRQAQLEGERRAQGIPLAPGLLAELRAAGDAARLPFPTC